MELLIGVDRQARLLLSTSGARPPTVSLTFTSVGVSLGAPGCPEVLLPWDTYGDVGSTIGNSASGDHWRINPYTSGRSGPIGIAVSVCGAYERSTEMHRKVTMTRWRRLNSAVTTIGGSSLLVLRETARKSLGEYATLAALCRVLVVRRDLRPRLDEPQRAQRLAIDLMRSRPTFGPGRTGVGRDSTDIHVALRQAGFVHEFGRPLTTARFPPLQQVVAEVVARLTANPYREGRDIDLSQVIDIVRRDYLAVAPWPFAALVDD